MKSKFKILIIFITLAFSLSIMSNTYSRYVADATGDVELTFAKWQILVNNEDITNGEEHNVLIMPTIIENKNVASNKLAPASVGYYDIEIDPTNVETSFTYRIEIADIDIMPDLKITKYQILDELNEQIAEQEITNNTIEGTFNYNVDSFNTMKLRIYFEWYDEADNAMSDEEDTLMSKQETISIATNISFEQKLD